MPKTLWILNHYAQEPGRPGGTRHYSLARHLLPHGWETHIIAAGTEHNTGRQRIALPALSRGEAFDGIPFLWLWTPVHQGNGLGRIANMAAYTVQALVSPAVRRLPPPDAVIGSSVHPLAAWAGAVLARRHGAPFIFEIRDLWPQSLVDMGHLAEGSLATRSLRALERHLCRRARRIVVLMPKAGNYLRTLGVTPGKIAWIPNGFDRMTCPPPCPPQEHEEFVLMYFGGHGNANMLDMLFDALVLLRGRPLARRLTVRLIGDGPLKPALMDRARREGLAFVRFEDAVPKSRIPALSAEADGFIVCLADLPIYRYGISLNKLFDYLAAGRPVIMAGNPVNNPVADARAGFTVKPEPAAVAQAIAELVAMPMDARCRWGKNGRRHVEERYAYDNLARQLGALLDEVAAEHQGQE